MTSHPSNEERPRITITAQRHDVLLAAEARLEELHGAGLKALELAGRTMIELGRARQAGRRLAVIHKTKQAELEDHLGCHKLAFDVVEQWKNVAEAHSEEMEARLSEATDVILQGMDVVKKNIQS